MTTKTYAVVAVVEGKKFYANDVMGWDRMSDFSLTKDVADAQAKAATEAGYHWTMIERDRHYGQIPAFTDTEILHG